MTDDETHKLFTRYDGLADAASSWRSHWQELANYFQPRKGEIEETDTAPHVDREARLYDTTGVHANLTLAAGQLSWMTPRESKWFALEPPPGFDDNDEIADWHLKCTEALTLQLASSNFYSQIHELYLDRGGFGTSVIHVERGRDTLLNFRTLTIGHFVIDEDHTGMIDTVGNEFELTARNAAAKFGVDNLPETIASESLAEGSHSDIKHKFVQLIKPRDAKDTMPGAPGALNMPIASYILSQTGKKLVLEGGYREMPAIATRYLKWSDEAYGWCPGWAALPDQRQLNSLQRSMDTLGDVAAFPRILNPDTHEGTVDLRPHGVTYYNASQPDAVPTEWLTGGRYDIGLDRVKQRQEAVERAFHVDLFTMFAQLDKNMTATEVMERAAEKLVQFSPTFSRMTTELIDPLLHRCFSLAVQESIPAWIQGLDGIIPRPPEALLSMTGGEFLPPPQVVYTSRVALAIKELENVGVSRTLEVLSPVIEADPSVADNFDMDALARKVARNNGMPSSLLRPRVDRDAIRQARMEQMAKEREQQQLAQAVGQSP